MVEMLGEVYSQVVRVLETILTFKQSEALQMPSLFRKEIQVREDL